MTWAKLDDGFYDHPKIFATSNAAVGLYCKVLSYCGKHLTDGIVLAVVVRELLRGTPKEIEELLANTLLEHDGNSYRIHDYLSYQPSSKAVKKERKLAKLRMRRVRANTSRRVRGTLVGTGRVKASSSSSPFSKSEKSTRRAVLAADYPLTDAHHTIAIDAGCRDPDRMHAAFVDYWHGEGKAKADWLATYRRWARTAHGGPANLACGCTPSLRTVSGKPSVRDMARDIAAEWAAEDRKT